MKIKKDCWVEIEYLLKDFEGTVLDHCNEKEPFGYVHGHGLILPPLEKALEGKKKDEEVSVRIKSNEAYGARNEKLIKKIPNEEVPNLDELEIGGQFFIQNENNEQTVLTVTKIEDDGVTVDANHPLAGVDLQFFIRVIKVRKANKTELSQISAS